MTKRELAKQMFHAVADFKDHITFLEKENNQYRKRAQRAESRLHAYMEHSGLDDEYDRLDAAEANVVRLQAVIDKLIEGTRWHWTL